MKISKQFDIYHGVHTMELLSKNRLAVLDISNAFRLFNLDEFELINGFKSNFETNVLYVNNMAISKDDKYIAFYKKNKKEINLFDREKEKFVHTINAHVGGVETVEFTLDNKYLISGGMEGRLYMWSVVTGKKVDTLSHHKDSVTAIASHENGRWIATAGYDKMIKVFNRSFRKNHYKLISHQEAVTTVTFLSAQRLLSTDKEGVILIWDIVKSTVITRLPKFDSHITAVCIDKDEHFLYVAGIAGMVGLYDLKEEKLLKLDFLKQLGGITQMSYSDEKDMLVFGLSNGHIPIYLFSEFKDDFAALMQAKKFNACYEMAEENPLLIYTSTYENLESLFNRAYEHATKMLRKNKTEDAKNLLKHFQASGAKRLLVQKLFNDYALFATFAKAVQSKKYMMAYSLAHEYTSLQETPEYEHMEKVWSKILLVVKGIINDRASEEKIKQLFRPFMGIPGKNLIIKSLYSNRNVFALFNKHLDEKDYFNAFKLVKGYPFLEEFDEYTRLVETGKILKESTVMTFNEGEYYGAVKKCTVLSFFPEQKEFAEELRLKANIYAETMQYYADKEFGAVYNMLEVYPYLEDTKITQDIEKGFLNYYEKAENYAAAGNVAALKTVMGKFSNIKSKQPSILHLFKIAYWSQIEEAALARASDALLQKGFEKYQKVFGYESALDDLLQSIKQTRALNINFDVTAVKSYGGSLEALEMKIIDF